LTSGGSVSGVSPMKLADPHNESGMIAVSHHLGVKNRM
jgi:hypothetical protein